MKRIPMRSVRFRVIMAGAALALALMATTTAQALLSEGKNAPSFKLTSIDGKTVSLSDLRKDPARKGANRVVLLDFWATWCPPCRKATPHLQKLHEKYGNKGLVVVGLALDKGGADDVKPFVKKHKLTYTILVDSSSKVARQYGVRGIPTAYIIDKKGVIRNIHVGYSPGLEKDLEKEVQALLNEPKG